MKYKSAEIKNILISIINWQKPNLSGLVSNPEINFLRTRKFPYEKVVLSLLCMEGASLNNELLRQFGCDENAGTLSAFIQQRWKILPNAFEKIFKTFTEKTDIGKKYKGYRLLAADGSDIQIAANPNDPDSFFQTKDGIKPYNLLHLNALYDILDHTYKDAVVSKSKTSSENKVLTEMIDRSSLDGKVIVIADRGYEAYNNMAHIKEKGWFYLIRIKDFQTYPSGIMHGFNLPQAAEFDQLVNLKLTRRQTNEIKELCKDKNRYRRISSNKPFDYLPAKSQKDDLPVFYELPFRIVRFQVTDGVYETVVTNLSKSEFPPNTLKELYAMRWGIETSFRDLKYTIGLLHFHSKKEQFILQEIFSRLTMYNFSRTITSHVIIEKKDAKHVYKVNFSVAAHICREFLRNKCSSIDLEKIIARYVTPIRRGRSLPRKMQVRHAISFSYRIA